MVLLLSRRFSISLDIMVAERLVAIMGDVWIDRQHQEGMIGGRNQPLQDTLREMYGDYTHTFAHPPVDPLKHSDYMDSRK